ncbi:Hypothetical Protein FCC1311_005222 [Hondaea fermentalgiana]|uniref:Uncharacterized protein n=1 Tax=Hondaea fermentalgiana TaxID=2315210 RepID=A0A2R5G9F1_9STRA|nr:Hypothetical Protein FCC1311_005222 [Hondaea fermentalgiana]|eukprot:GBG24304.1 Hypothetical Protein FCC1311_005222 [Hondaea fermentalgiana]
MDDDTGLAAWSLTQLATALAGRLAPLCSGRAVCELGCGVQPAALPLVRATAQKNTSGPSNLTSSGESCEPPRRLLLTDVNVAALEQLGAKVRELEAPFAEVASLDWADDAALDRLQGAFDLVLASEVLYYNVDLDALMRAGATILDRHHGMWIFCSFLRGTSLRALRDAAHRQGLAFRLLDIFRVNQDLLQSPAQVEGYAALAVLHAHELPNPLLLWKPSGLAPFEISLDDAIAEEDEEEAQATGAMWSAPFAGSDDEEKNEEKDTSANLVK